MSTASSPRLSPSSQRAKTSVTIKTKEPQYANKPRPLPRAKIRSAVSSGSESKLLSRPISSSRALAKSAVTVKTSTNTAGNGKASSTSRVPYPKPPPPPKVVKAPEKRTTIDKNRKASLPNGTINALHVQDGGKGRSSNNSSTLNRVKSASGARERTPGTAVSLINSDLSLNAKEKKSRPGTAPSKALGTRATRSLTSRKAPVNPLLDQMQATSRPPVAPKPAWLSLSITKKGNKTNQPDMERRTKEAVPSSPTLPPPQPSDLQMKMKRMFEEILQTEEQYVSHLEHICKHCIPAMDNVAELPGSLVGKKNTLFINIPQILELHRGSILPGVRKAVAKPLTLGSVFLDNKEALMEYAVYMSGAHQQDELLHAENESFFSAIQAKLGDKLPLSAYLIKPVQRMTKYKQFLEQIISHASKSTENFEAASITEKEDCVSQLKLALKEVDHVLQRGNDLLSLASLKDYKGNIRAEGKLLKVGHLTIIDTLKVKHRRKVFLFENSIIFSKIRRASKSGPTGSDIYQFMSSVRMTELGIRHQIAGHPSWFEITKGKETYQLEAPTTDEKKVWVDEISTLLDSQRKQLRDKILETHQGNKPVALYDIPCWGPPQNSHGDFVDSVESPPVASSAKPQQNIVSAPRLLKVTIGSPVSSRASSKEPLYDYPMVTVNLPLPVVAGRESSEESDPSGDDSSPYKQRGQEAAKEEINVLQMFQLRKYTIPSFPVISVKLRHTEIRRPNKSGVGSVVLDAYIKEKIGASVPPLPQKILVYESCVIAVPEFSKAISISSNFRIVRGRGVLVIWDWEWLEQSSSSSS